MYLQENPKVIRLLMGHEKVKTMIYNIATTNKYLQKAVDVFDERYAPGEPTPAPKIIIHHFGPKIKNRRQNTENVCNCVCYYFSCFSFVVFYNPKKEEKPQYLVVFLWS